MTDTKRRLEWVAKLSLVFGFFFLNELNLSISFISFVHSSSDESADWRRT